MKRHLVWTALPALLMALPGCAREATKAVVEAEPVISLEAAAPAVCSTGRTMAETLVCDDGDPSIFRQVSNAALILPKCVWYTEQLMLNENEFLVFRNQDCSAEGMDGAAYEVVGDAIYVNRGMVPESERAGEVILEMFTKAEDQTAEEVIMARLAEAPAAEKDRCIVRADEAAMFEGALYALEPDDEFLAELQAANEVYAACGPYGVTSGVQFFEDRGSRVLFHRLGQDQGDWDPASFTFYLRGADGTFAKAVEN